MHSWKNTTDPQSLLMKKKQIRSQSSNNNGTHSMHSWKNTTDPQLLLMKKKQIRSQSSKKNGSDSQKSLKNVSSANNERHYPSWKEHMTYLYYGCCLLPSDYEEENSSVKNKNNSETNEKFVIGVDCYGEDSIAGPTAFTAALINSSLFTKSKEVKEFISATKSKDLFHSSDNSSEVWFDYGVENWVNMETCTYVLSIEKRYQIRTNQVMQMGFENALTGLRKSMKQSNFDKKVEFICLSHKFGTFFPRIIDGPIFRLLPDLRMTTCLRETEPRPVEVDVAFIQARRWVWRWMALLSDDHKEYQFDVNKGRCTEQHLSIIRRIGCSPVHRTDLQVVQECHQQYKARHGCVTKAKKRKRQNDYVCVHCGKNPFKKRRYND